MQQIRRHFATLVGMGAVILTTIAGTPRAMAQTELATITASDFAANKNFGQSVGLSGNYAIVGAPGSISLTPSYAGAAYIFHWDGSNWSQTATLTASDGAATDLFGTAVAIHGDVAVVGAPRNGSLTGAAYVFRRSGSIWTQEAKLTGAAGEQVGDAVAIEGDRIVFGSPFSGKAYLFERILSTWTQQAEFSALALPASGDQFGGSVDISGDSVIVGARMDDDMGVDAGAAYVFNLSGSWAFQEKLFASDANPNDRFGEGVSISGNTVAVGAPGDDETDANAGACYVFDRSGVTWTEDTKARSTFGTPAADGLGNAVALDFDVLVVGGKTGGTGDGHAAIFQRFAGVWTEDPFSPVVPMLTGANDQFGTSVSVEGTIILSGAPGNDAFALNAGSATFFEVNLAPAGDTDGDGLDDVTEIFLADGGPCPDPFNPDTDGDGLSDGYENDFGPGICTADTDSDGLSDGAEVLTHGTNPTVADSDADGLNDGAEIGLGTNPLNLDTDGDGLNDGLEIAFATNPLVTDTDGDGLSDGDEVTIAAGSGCPNPAVADSDGDGLNDGIEHPSPILDPCDADSDNDGLSDGAEGSFGTSPGNPDSDNDGLLDGQEVALAGAGSCPSPIDSDSDNDGVLDGDELTAGSGPCDTDSDDDGLNDANEIVFGTNPLDNDSDNDGMYDGAEVDAAMGSGCPSPLDSDSDNDGLNDGAETALHTSLCNPDTDGDGLNDGVDPNPLVPAITPHILACMTLATAGEFIDTPTSQFLGPNNVAKQTRRATLASLTALAAVAIERHQYAAAMALLTTVEKLIDGASPPPDWMNAGSAKTQIHTDVENLLTLLDLIS